MKSVTGSLAVGSIGWVIVLSWFALGASADVKEGTVAPDFTLKANNGANTRLQELRGQVVLVNFWATWCGPCRDEMPKLNQLYRQYSKLGFTVLGVNIDDNPATGADMARSLGVTFPVLFDRGKLTSKLYEVDAMPTTVIVDRDGKIRYRHRGYKTGYESTYQTEIRALLKE
jgi:peroxiredoxin